MIYGQLDIFGEQLDAAPEQMAPEETPIPGQMDIYDQLDDEDEGTR